MADVGQAGLTMSEYKFKLLPLNAFCNRSLLSSHFTSGAVNLPYTKRLCGTVSVLQQPLLSFGDACNTLLCCRGNEKKL